MDFPISHAVVLPDKNFEDWLKALDAYMKTFERVVVVRSPAGNDLNRFRDITAVQTAGVWHRDDALGHIRRAYPMVVRVDVISASTSQQLKTELDRRASDKDRYGEKRNNPRHIFDRFTLEWMTDARPTRITRPFSSPADRDPATHEGFDIQTYDGAKIMAAASGVVSKIVLGGDGLNYGTYLQTTSVFDSQTYIVTYAGLKDIKVSVNQQVRVGDTLALAAGDAVKIVVQNPPGGMTGFKLPNVIDPLLLIYWQGLRLRPTVSALRVRDHPSQDGEIIGTVTPSDRLETQEVHGRTLAKIGVEGQWIRIRRAGTNEAYAAGWYLTPVGLNDPVEAVPGVPILGMNIDIYNNLGRPDPNLLKNVGWVRLPFNVSKNPDLHEGHPNKYGNTDVGAAFNRYRPELEKYHRAGKKIILVLTHQTYGEGRGYVWHQMNSDLWKKFTGEFVEIIKQVARLFAPTGMIYAYQVWNEQDTALHEIRSAVGMPVEDYAHLLSETIKAIRENDSRVRILMGGLKTSPHLAAEYARATLARLPGGVRPNGAAFHPYGQGPAGHEYSIYGEVGSAVEIYQAVLPGVPVWLTEWGILDAQGNDSIAGNVASYGKGFMDVIKKRYPGQVAAAIWYGWSDAMDNGYGVTRKDGSIRPELQNVFLA